MLIKKFRLDLGEPAVKSASGRYYFYKLDSAKLRATIGATPALVGDHLSNSLEPLVLSFGKEFYGEERTASGNEVRRHNWSLSTSSITVENTSSRLRTAELKAKIWGDPKSNLVVERANGNKKMTFTAGKSLAMRIVLQPHEKALLRLFYDGPRIVAPGDSRSMFFALENYTVVDLIAE